MPSIPTNLITFVEIVSRGIVTQTGVPSKNFFSVWQFRRTNNFQPLSKTDIEGHFQTTYMVPLIALLNAAYLQVSNDVRFLDDATDPFQSIPRTVVGGIVGVAQQNYDSVAYQFQTGYRGKSGRGGKRLGPLSDADTLQNVLTGAALIAWTALRGVFLGGFSDTNGNVWVPTVVSKGVPPGLSQLRTNPTRVFANDVVGVVLNKTTGTMRRRKVRTIVA
jgi:hypothetical protein